MLMMKLRLVEEENGCWRITYLSTGNTSENFKINIT